MSNASMPILTKVQYRRFYSLLFAFKLLNPEWTGRKLSIDYKLPRLDLAADTDFMDPKDPVAKHKSETYNQFPDGIVEQTTG